MKTEKAQMSSGKTHFNRIKVKGEDWTKLRREASAKGEWKPSQHHKKEDYEFNP